MLFLYSKDYSSKKTGVSPKKSETPVYIYHINNTKNLSECS